ncbi:MAG: acyl carrier protein [Planctomycetota bacterium]
MTVQDTVADYICRELLFNDRDRMPEPTDPLLGAGGVVDSFGLQQLIDFVEKTFKVQVADLDIVPENFETLVALTSYIERKQGRK